MPTTAVTETATGRWTQERRLEFIDFRLRWDGALNRSDLTDFFGISVPQASLDIARYSELAPDNLEYDRSARTYRATRAFRAMFAASSAERFLRELLSHAKREGEGVAGILGFAPSVDVVPNPSRRVNLGVVVALQRALREGTALRVVYQSLSREEPAARTISPHAFAHDGHRWHVRAWCHERASFRDFVIARVIKVQGTAPRERSGADDVHWNTMVKLTLIPHPQLSAGHRRAIELDYGMTRGRLELRCRQALLLYALRNLRLDTQEGSPKARQIVLENAQEVRRYLAASDPAGVWKADDAS